MSVETNELTNKILGKYLAIKFLAGGSYGSVYLAEHIETKKKYAIKFEPLQRIQTLQLERYYYNMLGKHSGIPEIHYFGNCGNFAGLVLDLLGPSIDSMHSKCANKFTIKTTALLAIQLIDIFDYIHSKRIVFRDVKPENFLLGLPGTEKALTLHVVDFGMSKEFISAEGKHVEYNANKTIVIGTPLFLSGKSHQNKEQSRRDDLEAVAHLIIYLAKGELPWEKIKTKSEKEMHARFAKEKLNITPNVLCKELPKPFVDYVSKVRRLRFTEKPNYSELKQLFTALLPTLKGPANQYDWDKNHQIIKEIK